MLVNISNASMVLELFGQIVTPGSALGVAVSGNYAYVADYHNGMQVYDVADPTNPVQIGHIDIVGDVTDVCVQGDYAYVSVSNTSGSLEIINISDPYNPFTEGSFPAAARIYSAAVSGNNAYLADGTAGLRIIDISTPSAPAFVGEYNTTGTAQGICVEGTYAYLTDSNPSLRIIDISNPEYPVLLGTFDTTSYSQRGVAVRDDYAYVCNYSNGLQIVDVSDPYNPLSAASFITESAYDVELYNDYAFITSYYTGASLKVVNISDPLNPALEWSRAIGQARGIAIAGNNIYLVNRIYLMVFKDVSNTANSSICGTVTDSPGSLIEGVVVQIANNDIQRNDTTDVNGNYCLNSIPEGTYDISFSHPDYCDEVLQDIQVDPDDTAYVDIAMDVGEITGVITGSDLVPIQGAIARVKYTNVIDTSDINGNYSLHILCPGTYTISVTHPDYCARTFTNIQVDPSDTTNFDMVLYEASEIYGTITNLEMEPIQGISVTVVDLRIRDYSDENGQYYFADICPGIYDIEFEGPQNCYILYENVTINPETPFQLNVMIGNNSTISGTVTGPNMLPLQGVIVSALGTNIADTTDSNGQYSLIDLYPSIYYLAFQLDGYWYPGNTHFVIGNSENIVFNATMCIDELFEPIDNIAYFWAGGNFNDCDWDNIVVVAPDQWVDIPIYHMSGSVVYIGSLAYIPAAKRIYLDQFDHLGCRLFYPLSEWAIATFVNYNDDTHPTHPNPPGYHSLTFLGWARDGTNTSPPLLHCEIPAHIMSFRVHAANDENLIGYTYCDAMVAGMDFIGGASNAGDSTGGGGYPMDMSFACVRFVEGYEYLPGDVNMYVGQWPPRAIVGDVTYLVNYFRALPTSHACFLDGFWASADVNGDCQVIGSDVTKLINYLRGQTDLSYCPDYPPSWFFSSDLPEDPPPGWPGCE